MFSSRALTLMLCCGLVFANPIDDGSLCSTGTSASGWCVEGDSMIQVQRNNPREVALISVRQNEMGSRRTAAQSYDKQIKKAAAIPDGLLDGCSSVFLDLGANAGIHPRMLFEPELYTKDTYFLSLMDKYFGPPEWRRRPSSESGICAVAFEGNPSFADRHKAIQTAYAEMGWRVNYFTPLIAATRDDDQFQFHISSNAGDTLGSSILDRDLESPERKWVEHTLPAINFAKFVQTQVVGRRLPTDVHPPVPPAVFMKVDIEGGEFMLIPHMRDAGVLCGGQGIDAMIVEEHTRIVQPATHGNFTSWADIQSSIQQQSCKVPKMLDDPEEEVYWNDPNEALPGSLVLDSD